MIRLMRCLRRRNDISEDEFRRYWQDEEYAELLRTSFEAVKGSKYSTKLVLKVELNKDLMDFHDTQEPFDAVIEIWWDDPNLFRDLINSVETEELRFRLNAYEDQFIDRSTSQFFLTE